jgi:hypothetical protein
MSGDDARGPSAVDAAPPVLDLDLLGAVLRRHAVRHVIIGGIAVIAHGHLRATFDVDLIPDPDLGNLARLAAALAELDARVRGVDAHLLDVDPTDPAQLAGGANSTLTTSAGWIDVMLEVPGARAFEDLAADAIAVREGALTIVGLDDLVAMKRASGRPRDLEDAVAVMRQRR